MLTWKQKTIIKILLIIASMLSENEEITREIKSLAVHISVSYLEIERK